MKVTYVGNAAKKERGINVTYTGGAVQKTGRVKATYVGGAQSKAVYDAEAKTREARQNAAGTQKSTGREVGNISALGAGNYGADKRIFGEGYNVGQGLAKAGQIGLTQIAKVGSIAGAWLENQLGNFAREGTNGYWDPDTSKWLFNRWNQAIDAEAQGVQQRYAENTQRGGRAAEVFEDMAAATVAAIPQAGAAFLTGSASAAAQAGALAERAAATPGLVGTISRGMRAMAKDPNFQLSFVQVFGPGYEQAKADGADDLRASLYAVGNGLMNAAVEVGGGIQTLPKELQTGGSAWKSWVDSMLEEGKEEVVQGVIERAMQNTVYGRDNPYIGVGNGAIFDPAAAAEEFAGGAVVGGLLGGGQIGLNTLANRAAYNAAKAQYDRDVRQNTAPEMDSKAAQAVDAVTRGESITGNQAAAIAKNPVAVETLEANTGVKLNTQQPISQLKRDIAALASRDTTQTQSQGATATPVAQRRAQKPAGGFLEAGQKAYQEMSRTAEDVPTLYAGFSSVYNAGLNGIEASKAKGAYAAMLTPEQRYAAYNAGLEDAAAQVARENAEVKSVTTTAGAGLADNVYSRAVIAKSKRTAATLNAMGKKLGVRIEFVDSVMGGQANGQYIRDKNLIQIAVDSNKPYLNVAAHEVTHRMQDLSPAEYRKFRQAAMEHHMREKGIDEMAEVVEWYREKAESAGVTLTQDEVMDEIAADFAGDMMENPDLFREFSQSNRTAAQKLLDSLKEFIAKVKSIFTGKARDVAAQEAYGKDFAELEAVAQKWQEAFDAAEQQAERATVSATVRSGDTMQYDDAVYSLRVTDKDTLDFLNKQKTITTYKTMQLVDGKLYPPMAARVDGKYEDASELGAWEMSVERPDLVKDGKFKLDKGRGQGSLTAAYNPYMHSSNLVINDQFSGAYTRDNLVTVECEVPVSEMTSGYHADGAKDSVGWHSWHTGTVAGQIRRETGVERKVFLSRWIKPVRILPDAEVANMYKELLGDTGIEVPDNVVTPGLLAELKKAGVPIKESGRVKTAAGEGDGAKYQIKQFPNGMKYVQADRQVLFGNDPVAWSEQLENYINGKIRNNEDVRLIAEDGDILILTRTSAGKLSSRYNNYGQTMSDETFERKANAASHIDELIKVSVRGGETVLDEAGRHGDMAKDGWNYRTAYFMDFDGKYYRTRISVALGKDGSIVYNIGKMQERSTPRIAGSSGNSGALLGNASGISILTDGENVNRDFQLRETQRLPDELEDLRDTYIRRYGEIPEGENATRQVRLPRKTSDKEKVSQTVRTILEANATPDEIVPTIEELALRGEYSYEAYSDKQAISDAETKIKDVGWAQALTSWTDNVRRGNVSKESTAMGWALYNNAANSGDTATALAILNNMVEHQRSAAQALQATRILKKLNPETQLYQVQRSVKNLQEEINKRYGDKKSPELKIDQELAERFLRAKDQTERDNALTDIYRDIGRQMPSRFIDKWNAWRYLAMLGNARTHIRNIVGNAGFAPVVAVKNAIATGIEAGVNKVSGGKLNRSKAFVSGKGGKALFSAAAADFDKIQDVTMGGGKYSEFANANKAIEEGRVIFQSKMPGFKQVSKGLEKARRFNSAALETEDMWFSKPHYAYAMAQYCKANGITAEMIAEGKGIEKARKYAIKEAQKATYRDTNAFSQFVSEIGRRRGSKTGVEKIATGIIEGILPFRKTPANILMRGVEYSPLGLANGIKQALWDVRTGKKTGAEAIDSISAGLTGTGLLRLGVYLASQALLRGHGGDDDDKREFEDLQGHQTYSLELPDGTSITLDWLAPECLPLFIGVNLWEETNGGRESLTLSELLTAISNVSEPLLEMSCLQSLNAIFDVVGYAKSDGIAALPKAIASAATSYLTQALPTLLGQAERTGEGKRYTTYTNKNNKYLTPDMQYAVGKASARIPGWDYNQIPYIDAWGRTELTGTPGERAFNNFLNPAYTSKIDETPMEKELMRLYNATGESVFPSRASKNLTVNGEAVTLGADDYVKYAQQKGQGAYKRLTALTRDFEYKKLTNEEKVRCVKDIYTLTDQIAKSKFSKYEPESWVTKAIAGEKKGISATDYVIARAKTSDVESLKDKNGKTIANSKGLLVMEQIYSIDGLTSDQRQYLFSAMGVGKKIIHYNKALVQQELRKMRNQ